MAPLVMHSFPKRRAGAPAVGGTGRTFPPDCASTVISRGIDRAPDPAGAGQTDHAKPSEPTRRMETGARASLVLTFGGQIGCRLAG